MIHQRNSFQHLNLHKFVLKIELSQANFSSHKFSHFHPNKSSNLARKHLQSAEFIPNSICRRLEMKSMELSLSEFPNEMNRKWKIWNFRDKLKFNF